MGRQVRGGRVRQGFSSIRSIQIRNLQNDGYPSQRFDRCRSLRYAGGVWVAVTGWLLLGVTT
jgi:hypothetical protein